MMRTAELLCPESLMADANHLAAAKGKCMDDMLTFRTLNYTDGVANYCWVGVQVGDDWISGMATPPSRPEFDTGNEIDMAKALAVLSGATILTALPEGESVIPSGLVVYVGTGLPAAYGLNRIVSA